MSIKSRRRAGALAFAVLLGILSAAPAAAACKKCTHIPFVGWECFPAGQNESGETQCYDSNGGCHTYGTPCSGTGGGGDECDNDVPHCGPYDEVP